ncbi:tyrosine-type recombinase/integrase [Sediminicoccus rosea]|uniref:Tyrosine-type recombinase/integrase n=1 Tax=Sediminicoccus rosea TaxID=1225128 RepID=A0ABZ0PBK7_9PROT|nr:integrase arm-type DNA-binding domain-containing protein [Sediminicoccus rosea]WPB83088.1 tyrosine-type recombinase/integrase [Sediminicoccus rosea]
MAKAAAGLTVAKAKSLLTKGEPGKHAAGGGLYLMVKKPGVAVWAFRFTVAGKLREMGLGPVDLEGRSGGVTLREAQDRAADAKRLLRDGVDPIDQRKAERAAKAEADHSGKTFKEAAEAYIATHGTAWRNPKHRAQWDASLKTYVFPKIGEKAVGQVTRENVLEILRPIWTTKRETARRVRQRVEMIFAFASAQGWLEGINPTPDPKLAMLLLGKVAKDVKHHAALPWQEIAPFMKRLRAQGGTAARALEFTILTAARTGEVIGAKWSEIDLQAGVWTVPGVRMKAKKEHRVPLSVPALALLASMLPLKPEEGDGYVFPGQRKGKGLSNMSMLKTLERMKAGEITAHGFRSTFRDWAGEATAHPREVVEMALAHTIENKVEASYRRGDAFEKRRVLMDEWAAFCDREPGEVVPLRPVAAVVA